MKIFPRRRRIELDEGWTFLRARISRAWLRSESPEGENVSLPHSFNESDTWAAEHQSYRGSGGYRCGFHLPDDGLHYRLQATGSYGITEIFIDGHLQAKVDPQFLGWRLDLDPSLRRGPHILGLRMDSRYRRDLLPAKKMPDFILHGGLSGSVFLEEIPPVHLDEAKLRLQWKPYEEGWEISISGTLSANAPLPAGPEISWSLGQWPGTLLEEIENVEIRPQDGVSGYSARIRTRKPASWSPSSPVLSYARIILRDGEKILDEILLRFGLTDPEFRPGEGFFLNKERLELHGVNRHQSMPGFGKALPEELDRFDAEQIKGLGANFVRLSHYPQSSAFLDACDELGLMLYPEIATWKSVSSRRAFRRAARRQMQEMILRDRHRPSILLWGMGNESRSARAYRELAKIIHRLDPLRPSVYAENHLYRARRKRTIGLADVWGINYELEVLKEARSASRLGNVIISECCNHPHSLRGDEAAELIQLGVLERDWETMARHPWLAGYAVWCYADYATEYRHRVRRLAGLFDAWRQPKMAAELFRARHSTEVVLALFMRKSIPPLPPSSYRREIGDASTAEAALHLFSNLEELHLEIDGKEMLIPIEAPHTMIHLPHVARQVNAAGSLRGVELHRSWQTHGRAAEIKIHQPVPAVVPGLTFYVDLSIRDEAGLIVENFSDRLQLRVEGPARLRSFSPEGLVEISRGTGRAFFTAAKHAGEIRIRAVHPGLPPAQQTWTFRRTQKNPSVH